MQGMESGTTVATFYVRNISKRGLFGAFGQNSTPHQHFSLFHVTYHSVIITLEDKFFGGAHNTGRGLIILTDALCIAKLPLVSVTFQPCQGNPPLPQGQILQGYSGRGD